jgi:hypothetical protein
MPTTTQPVATGLNLSDARCEALFASALQPSDAPSAAMVSKAITCAVRKFGVRGCAALMAQEFGDHPDAAAGRMRWVRRVCGAPLEDQHARTHRARVGNMACR